MTPLELTLKCHSRSIDYIQDSIEYLEAGNKTKFVENINNALKILENFMYSLQITLPNGDINNAAYQSFFVYEFITKILRTGLINFNYCDFEQCCTFLEEIHDAYSNMY